MVVQNQVELGEGSAILTDPHHTPIIIESSTQPQKTQKPRKPKRKDTQVPYPSGPIDIVVDKAVHKELGDKLVRAATTASSLEVEQDSDEDITLVNVQDDADNEMFDENALDGEEMFDAGQNENVVEEVVDAAQVTAATTETITTEELTLAQALEALKTSKPKYISTLFRLEDQIQTFYQIFRSMCESDSDSKPLNKQTTPKLNELMELCTTLQKKVLDLEKTKTTQANEIASLKRRVKKLEKKRNDADNEMYDVGTVTGDEIFAKQEEVQDKGKGKMIKPKPVKKISKKDQLRSDEEEAKRLQAEFDEEERLAREKDEANLL
ncbi:hypothetical protein Tco_1424873 [Tanacetum coccineum]